MAKWKKVKGVSFRLLANPKSLASASTAGDLQLEYVNPSRVPVSAAVLSLHSSDPVVASPSNGTTGQIHVSARPGKKANPPYRNLSPIGNWSPNNQGNARLNAHVDVSDQFARPLRTVDPDEDVQVT
jgi:hypothetical protein